MDQCTPATPRGAQSEPTAQDLLDASGVPARAKESEVRLSRRPDVATSDGAGAVDSSSSSSSSNSALPVIPVFVVFVVIVGGGGSSQVKFVCEEVEDEGFSPVGGEVRKCADPPADVPAPSRAHQSDQRVGDE
mmetsp:Transcript_67337/g.115665  ORF Transcript_67337/g.115665 Transcript_67337/m.115665 type:complete len:133 (+) Transcript_67337:186-584(+)